MAAVAPTVQDGESPSAEDGADAGAPGRLGPWVARVAVALTLAPLVVSAVHLTVRYGNQYNPGGDLAMAELLTRDVGRHPVLIGPFSRDEWHHPGPALYYVLAVPYRLLGSRATAMNVGALAVHAASIAGIAVLARRRGGQVLMLISLLGCGLLVRSLGPTELQLPWNPYVTVLPYALLVFLTWSLACGERWALPLAVLVASFVAQTHIGYVALAVPLVALGAGWLVATTVRRARGDGVAAAQAARSLLAPALVAVAGAVVMWLPPLYQQAARPTGNLTAAFRWFRGDGGVDEGPQTLRVGWRVVTSQLGVPPEWLSGSRGVIFTDEPVDMYEPLAPVLLLGVIAAAVVLARRHVAGGRSLVAVWALASAVGVVAVARTIGPVFEYRLGWAQVLGMVAGVIMAWAGWLALARWRPALEGRLLVPAALVALAVLAVVGSVDHVQAGEPQHVQSAQIRGIMPDIVEGLPPGDGPILVDTAWSFDASVHAASIVLQLDRRGIDGVFDQGSTAGGEHRGAYDAADVRARLVVAVGDDIPVVAELAGATLLGRAAGAPDDGYGAPVAPVAVYLVDDGPGPAG
ncbi:MAG TPA: hypothetical protein VFH36_12740 [Acidimicrobiales bacterium]|nr:hypothetical protein [Acidimicrobiales bacterium]